ncbi:MAG: hypothetical protein IJW92_08180 [Clostridia bacterium]|nr:hypothetical protein [Clostridia bacterium]
MQIIRSTQIHIRLPQVLVSCLPIEVCDAVCRCGATSVEEIRLHSGRYTSVTSNGKNVFTNIILSEKEMGEILKRMCGGSLYAFSQTINRGYLTLEGGIRVGVCGTAALEKGQIIGVNNITGLMIRIPHTVHINPEPILSRFRDQSALHGVLIYAPPGIGKTTLLRAVAEAAASPNYGYRTVVVDSREELSATLIGKQLNLDILNGYPRDIGIEIAIRNFGAQLVICDEIGSTDDAHAILNTSNCGVPLIASAHAASVEELLDRPALNLLHRAHVFGIYAGIRRGGANGFVYQFTDWNTANEKYYKKELTKWSD